jgi:hypothetical protein
MAPHFSPIKIEAALVMPPRNLQHDRGVSDAWPRDSVDTQPRIDHRIDR